MQSAKYHPFPAAVKGTQNLLDSPKILEEKAQDTNRNNFECQWNTVISELEYVSCFTECTKSV